MNELTAYCDNVGVLFPTKNNLTVRDVCHKVKNNW